MCMNMFCSMSVKVRQSLYLSTVCLPGDGTQVIILCHSCCYLLNYLASSLVFEDTVIDGVSSFLRCNYYL